MTNKDEEKALQLAGLVETPDEDDRYYDRRRCEIYDKCLEMAAWKDEQYKGLIKMLVDELNTSKLYHLGITGLDTDEEIVQKRKDGDTALIRGIERTIKFVEESIK